MKKLQIRWTVLAFVFLISTAQTVLEVKAQDKNSEPISIIRQGYLFAGGKYSNGSVGPVISGQIYAEFQIPSKRTHVWPIVMIHGAAQTGTNFMGTPDGREGWAQFFLRQGYAVYVVDQVGRGRAGYEPEHYGPARSPNLENTEKFFVAPERYNLWPQAHLHTQWPGKGIPGDPSFDQFYASQVPSIQSFRLQLELTCDAILALLEKIGPSILLTHSQSGAIGWPVADARPDLVKAIVAVEPNGPPFFDVQTTPGTKLSAPDWFQYDSAKSRPWGITADPLSYSPAAASASDLVIVQQAQPDGPNLNRCWIQESPARKLPNLQKIPILILTGEASYHASYDHCTVKYLEQAGMHPTWIKLADFGVHGNGHMMMLEMNNLDIAKIMSRWLDGAVPVAPEAVKSSSGD